MDDTTILYRPVGQEELNLIRKSGYSTFPPRLPGQPIFYPVLSEEYATQIARDWNAVREGTGYVTRFRIRSNYISQHEVQTVGGSNHQEYWILAEELNEFNRNILGEIEVIGEFRACGETPQTEAIDAKLPTVDANKLMRIERLDGIGPARYAELDQLKNAVIKKP